VSAASALRVLSSVPVMRFAGVVLSCPLPPLVLPCASLWTEIPLIGHACLRCQFCRSRLSPLGVACVSLAMRRMSEQDHPQPRKNQQAATIIWPEKCQAVRKPSPSSNSSNRSSPSPSVDQKRSGSCRHEEWGREQQPHKDTSHQSQHNRSPCNDCLGTVCNSKHNARKLEKKQTACHASAAAAHHQPRTQHRDAYTASQHRAGCPLRPVPSATCQKRENVARCQTRHL
jgi:hypothetical protein